MNLSQNSIAVVDDDSDILLSARLFLKKYFQEIHCFTHPSECFEALKEQEFAVVLLDLNYRNGQNDGQEGLTALDRLKEEFPKTEVVMMTAYAEVKLAVEAVKKGAFDFVVKPWQNEKLLVTLMNAAQKRNMNDRLLRLAAIIQTVKPQLEPMLGESNHMGQIRELIHQMAPTEAAVLIKGATGSGKSLIAQHIHRQSKQQERALVSIDFSVLKEQEQLDALLGTNKGVGKWHLAKGGTLYLRSIFLMSVACQQQLLHLLQEKEQPRLLSSCREQKMPENFSKELLYRLNTIEVTSPSLINRLEDLPDLFDYFFEQFKSLHQKPYLTKPQLLMDQLKLHDWPGNIRELKRAIERAVVINKDVLQLENLIPPISTNSSTHGAMSLEELEKTHINSVLLQHNGNIQQAAAALQISRAALYRRIEKHQLKV